jgi:hypothetical protein
MRKKEIKKSVVPVGIAAAKVAETTKGFSIKSNIHPRYNS